MAGKDNLVPLTTEKAREIGKKGGIRSGEVKREKATFKKAIKWLLEDSDIKIKKGDIKERFKDSGINISKLNPSQLATLGLWMGAVQGNATNYKTLMEANEEIQLENETPNVNIQIIDNSTLEKVMYEEESNEED